MEDQSNKADVGEGGTWPQRQLRRQHADTRKHKQ